MIGMLVACGGIWLGQATEMVPDPSWTAVGGEVVTVKAAGADDGRGGRLPGGARVRVIRSARPAPKLRSGLDGGQVGRRLQDDIRAGRDAPVEVELLDGPDRHQVRMVAESDMELLVERPVRLPLRPGDRVAAPVAGLPFRVGDREVSLPRDARMVVLRDEGEAFEVRVLPPARLAGKVGMISARDHRFRIVTAPAAR